MAWYLKHHLFTYEIFALASSIIDLGGTDLLKEPPTANSYGILCRAETTKA